MSKGWVYVLINPSMPGLVKVGHTARDPQDRANELASVTGVATPFVVVFKEFFVDAAAAEAYVHTLLGAQGLRLNASREFFQTDATAAIKAVMGAPGVVAPGDVADDELGIAGEDVAVMLFDEGQQYHYGTAGTLKNPRKAYQLYEQAAALGFSDAWLAMGDMHLYGDVGRENPRQAAECFHNAIDQGNIFGYARLAHALESIDIKEADKAWNLFYSEYKLSPQTDSRCSSYTWYLASYVFRMALTGRRAVKIPEDFQLVRDLVREYLEDGLQHAQQNGNPVDLYQRSLAWLDAHP